MFASGPRSLQISSLLNRTLCCQWLATQGCMSGRGFEIRFGLIINKISGLIRALCLKSLQKHNQNNFALLSEDFISAAIRLLDAQTIITALHFIKNIINEKCHSRIRLNRKAAIFSIYTFFRLKLIFGPMVVSFFGFSPVLVGQFTTLSHSPPHDVLSHAAKPLVESAGWMEQRWALQRSLETLRCNTESIM